MGKDPVKMVLSSGNVQIGKILDFTNFCGVLFNFKTPEIQNETYVSSNFKTHSFAWKKIEVHTRWHH